MAKARTVLLIMLAGCSKTPSANPTYSSAITRADSPTGSQIVVAFAPTQHRDRLSEVAAGTAAKEYRWVRVVMPATLGDALESETGVQLSLTDSASSVAFSQAYLGPCNPAKDNFESCWLFESLTAGAPGTSGTIYLRSTAAEVHGSFDTLSEGLTDRFGDPVQWLRNQTLAEIIVEGGGS